jgi:hypothetical protein
MRRTRRFLACLAAALAISCVPAFGASLSVSSSTLATSRTCTLTPLTATSLVGTDTFANQNAATTANGTQIVLTANSRNNQNARVYLRFDLTKCTPTIPSTATVNSAVLRMVPQVLASACRTYDIFKVTASWVETTLTWNNQPFGTTVNNPVQSARTSSSDVGPLGCANSTLNAYTTGWNVTTDVAAFVAGTSTNNGWMIRDDVEDSGTQAKTTTFYSREANSINSPQLIIDYH